MKIHFSQDRVNEWTDNKVQTLNEINQLITGSRNGIYKNDFVVTISQNEKMKSLPQLRAIHKLCDLAIPYLEKKHGMKYDSAQAKSFIKSEINYLRPPTKFEVAIMIKSTGIELGPEEKKRAISFTSKIKQPDSFALASKEKMVELIEGIQAWAASEGFDNVTLEQQSFNVN